MARLPKGSPTLRDVLRDQRRQLRKQGTSSPFDGTGIAVGADGGMTLPGTLTVGSVQGYAPTSYVDAATAVYGLEAAASALTIPAATTTAVPWGAPTENTGGYVVAGNTVTVPAGKGGVYSVTVSLSVADTQPVRAFLNVYLGSSRSPVREVFTTDSVGSVSATARVSDLEIIKADVYCGTASSLVGGWITLYRLHS